MGGCAGIAFRKNSSRIAPLVKNIAFGISIGALQLAHAITGSAHEKGVRLHPVARLPCAQLRPFAAAVREPSGNPLAMKLVCCHDVIQS